MSSLRGEFVFVRDAWDRALIRRIWDVTPKVIYICSDERYKRLMKDEGSDLPPTGFPVENVYYYDPAILKSLDKSQNIWDYLTPFKSISNDEWSEQENLPHQHSK